jgi:hypothetical protein
MGWQIGFDEKWQRDVGYGVPCFCDHPECSQEIDRGLIYVCGGEPFGGERGCGLFFCMKHLWGFTQKELRCYRCLGGKEPYKPKADSPIWIRHKLTDESWAAWRAEHPEFVSAHTLKRPS